MSETETGGFFSDEVPEGYREITVDELLENIDAISNGREPVFPDGPIAIKVASEDDAFKLAAVQAFFPGLLA